jgi:T-complex protein 1 subunit theta
MVINHLEKLFVTNDAATILNELEVQHPAAKMLVLATQQQEQEVGDGTNFVLVFAGSLLEHAEMLLRMVRSISISIQVNVVSVIVSPNFTTDYDIDFV